MNKQFKQGAAILFIVLAIICSEISYANNDLTIKTCQKTNGVLLTNNNDTYVCDTNPDFEYAIIANEKNNINILKFKYIHADNKVMRLKNVAVNDRVLAEEHILKLANELDYSVRLVTDGIKEKKITIKIDYEVDGEERSNTLTIEQGYSFSKKKAAYIITAVVVIVTATVIAIYYYKKNTRTKTKEMTDTGATIPETMVQEDNKISNEPSKAHDNNLEDNQIIPEDMTKPELIAQENNKITDDPSEIYENNLEDSQSSLENKITPVIAATKKMDNTEAKIATPKIINKETNFGSKNTIDEKSILDIHAKTKIKNWSFKVFNNLQKIFNSQDRKFYYQIIGSLKPEALKEILEYAGATSIEEFETKLPYRIAYDDIAYDDIAYDDIFYDDSCVLGYQKPSYW